jgi:hypothetical protein
MEVQGARGQESTQPFDPAIAAKTMVYAMLLFRVIESPSLPKPQQVESVAGILRQSLKGLA